MSSSNPSFFLYTWIMAPMGTSSSYAHLKFEAPIPSLITLGFWLQWAPSNFFKLYTLEAFSLRHNETLSSFQDLSNATQALMNKKVGISKRLGARGPFWARLGRMSFSPAEAREAQARPKPVKGRAGPRASFQARPGPAGWPESWAFRPAQKPV